MSTMTHLEFLWIEPGQISTTNDTFKVRSRYPDSLLDSIRENGIRTPLLVQPAGDRHRLVSGWGRWKASGGRGPLPCYMLARERTEDELWDIFLRDNESWNVVEIARILGRLSELPDMTRDRIVREKFGLIGLHRAKDLLPAYVRLLELPRDAQEFIETEALPLRRASVFFKLPAEALPAFLSIARELRLTSSELSEVLVLAEEISRRDGSEPLSVLEAARSCGGQKASFLQSLRERRYPELSRYRAQLEAWTSELEFSLPVRVEWDPQLERPGLRLIVELADEDALDSFRRELETEGARLRRFFEVL